MKIIDPDFEQPLPITEGGTGATTESNARTNLGLIIGTDVQAYSSLLAAIVSNFAAASNGQAITKSGSSLIYSTVSGGGGSASYRERFTALQNIVPGSGVAATLIYSNGNVALEFAATGTTIAQFQMSPPGGYQGGNLVVKLLCAMSAGTTGDVVVAVAIERQATSTDSFGTDSFATAISATQAIPGTAGQYFHATITLSSSQIDGLTTSDFYRLRISRLGNDASDTATGILRVIAGEVTG